VTDFEITRLVYIESWALTDPQ